MGLKGVSDGGLITSLSTSASTGIKSLSTGLSSTNSNLTSLSTSTSTGVNSLSTSASTGIANAGGGGNPPVTILVADGAAPANHTVICDFSVATGSSGVPIVATLPAVPANADVVTVTTYDPDASGAFFIVNGNGKNIGPYNGRGPATPTTTGFNSVNFTFSTTLNIWVSIFIG